VVINKTKEVTEQHKGLMSVKGEKQTATVA